MGHQGKDWIARARTLSKNCLVKRRCSSLRDCRTVLRLSGHTRGSVRFLGAVEANNLAFPSGSKTAKMVASGKRIVEILPQAE